MAELRKILISVPVNLLNEVDVIVSSDKSNRSEFVREAMKFYIRERKKSERLALMQKGYQDMAEINRKWSELCVDVENEGIQCCEKFFRELE